MHPTTRLILATGLAVGLTGTAVAGCPPDCPSVGLTVTTLLTIDRDGLREEREVSLFREIRIEDLGGGTSGSVRLGLATPFVIGDPLLEKVSLAMGFSWTPSASWTPLTFEARYPLAPAEDYRRDKGFDPDLIEYRLSFPVSRRFDFGLSPVWGSGGGGAAMNALYYFAPRNPVPAGFTGPFVFDDAVFEYSLSYVPEPTSWALWIGGLGLAGGALRQRRWANA